jgi:hypothetical protein
MSSISGALSSTALYQQIQKKGQGAAVAEFVKTSPTVKAQEAAFTKSVARYKGANDLFSNYNDLSLVLTAFGQSSQIGNIGLLKKALASDLKDSKSVVNQLNNAGLKQLVQTLQTDGNATKSLQDPAIQAQIKNAYELTQYQNNLANTNPAVPAALNFASLVKSATSIYDILGNSTLRKVVSTVGNIPSQIVNQTVEAQGAAFAKVFDISKAKDSAYVEKFVKRYLVLSDVQSQSGSSGSSSLLSLFSSNSSSGSALPGLSS